MKKINLIIIAIALVLGLGQCKKHEEVLPETPEVMEGNLVHISVSVNGGSKHILYPESGAYVFQNGDKLYVGNHNKYVGYLEYQDGMFSGLVADPVTTDYLHFYFLGGLTPSDMKPLYVDTIHPGGIDTLAINITTSFNVSIADQSGGLPILAYGRSTTKYINETTAYNCMLENKCGLVKYRIWPAPSTTDTIVTISGIKTTAVVSFVADNAGITPTEDTGVDTLHHVIGTDAVERWAILLPQNATEATVSYKDQDNANVTQTIDLPAIKANSFYGGYHGISVGLEYVDLGLSSGRKWAACNIGSCTHEGFGTFFAWAETEPKSTYCWHSYKYAFNPKFYPENPPAAWITAEGSGYSSDDTLHHERSGNENKPNLGFFKYNTQEDFFSKPDSVTNVVGPNGEMVDGKDGATSIFFIGDSGSNLDIDDAAYVNWGDDWRIPTKQEWRTLVDETTQSWDVVNGVGGVRFTGKIQSWGDYTNKSIFLPAAGVYGGPMHSFYYNCGNPPHGEYWSNEINQDKPYQAYILYFDDPEYGGSMDNLDVASEKEFTNPDPVTHQPKVTLVEFIRNQGRPVRAVNMYRVPRE